MEAELEKVIGKILRKRQQDPGRLGPMADFAKLTLKMYGLPGVRGGKGGELDVTGLARTKTWDVAYEYAGKFRLLISLKSMWKNIRGSVPNRIDDLMGETANVQQISPEVVIGYIVLFDVAKDAKRRDGIMWSAYFENAIKRITIRDAPLLNQGLLEASWFILVDTRRPSGKRLANPAKATKEGQEFFKALIVKLRQREPAIKFTKDPTGL
jgi:hypothetical protein